MKNSEICSIFKMPCSTLNDWKREEHGYRKVLLKMLEVLTVKEAVGILARTYRIECSVCGKNAMPTSDATFTIDADTIHMDGCSECRPTIEEAKRR